MAIRNRNGQTVGATDKRKPGRPKKTEEIGRAHV